MKNLIIYSFCLVFSYGCQLQKTRLYEEEQEKRIATIQKIDFEAIPPLSTCSFFQLKQIKYLQNGI